MKHAFLLLAALTVLPACLIFADSPAGGVVYLTKVPLPKVLAIYEKLTGLNLTTDDQAMADSHTISYTCIGPAKSKEQMAQDLENVLREQAGIVITKTDNQQGTAKFDPALPIVTVNLPPPGLTMVSRPPVIVLNSKDVDTNSVRSIASPDGLTQNVMVRMTGRSSDEIKAIRQGAIMIQEGGTDIVEALNHTFLLEKEGDQLRYTGLILPFKNADAAKWAVTALRGE